jgi:serine-type D-Ala-D-Ala carboxypeptidase (penicillin-binding protein 5/6)
MGKKKFTSVIDQGRLRKMIGRVTDFTILGQEGKGPKAFGRLIFFICVALLPVSDCFAGALDSRAAVVIDTSTWKILYSKNANLRLPPASTTKLMTASVVLAKEDISKVVTISKNASYAKPSKIGFTEGDKITIEGLLYAALMESANDAAIALAEAVAGSEKKFVHLMNERALAMGATNTCFINSNGLPGSGQYTTALDLSKIMIHAMAMPKLREIIGTPKTQIATEDGKIFSLKNTDKLLWSDERIIGGKTGYTCKAKHCFVGAAQNEERTIIVALLGSPSRKNLWKETEKLLAKGF